MIRFLFILILTISGLRSFQAVAQEEWLKNSIYGGFGRHGLLFMKYERTFINLPYAQTFINAGIGNIPGSHEDGIPITFKLMPSIGQSIGYKFLFLEVAIEPSINFFGEMTYVDLNSLIGIRYQNLNKLEGSPFFQAGYYHTLFKTHDGMADVPLYMGVGMTF